MNKGISFTPINLLSFFSMLSPFFLTFYFIVDSAFNAHLKGIIFLVGLSIVQLVGILARSAFPGSIDDYNKLGRNRKGKEFVSAMCKVFQIPFETTYGKYKAPSGHAIFHFFTLSYILGNGIFGGLVGHPSLPYNGWPFVLFLIFLAITDIVFRTKIKQCEKLNRDIFPGIILGIIGGVLWYWIIYAWEPKATYYNSMENVGPGKCKLGKTKFTCKKKIKESI